MTKNELVFSIMDEIQKQGPTQDGLKATHPQVVKIEVAKAYDSIVKEFFNTPGVSNGQDMDYFTKSSRLQVQKSTADQLYVELTTNPLPLVGGVGIALVRPENSTVQIQRVSEAEFLNLVHLEAFCCSPVPFCYPEKSTGRVILQRNRREYDLLDYIIVKTIPKFTDFNDDEEINTPGGEYNLSQMVLQIMGIRPTDNTNDDGK